MGKIVAIGGGEIGRPGYPIETTKIDKEIIKLTGKNRPKFLFVPTASSDNEVYIRTVKKHFGQSLGCKVNTLYLIKEKPSFQTISNKILNSDIIYVGGGNTLRLIKYLRKTGVDKAIKKAYKKGIVLSGLSAGSICWFKKGMSDSIPGKWSLVRGLGFINAINNVHYSTEKGRKKGFNALIRKEYGVGIALENCCALEIIDEEYKIITSNKGANAYKIYSQKGKLIKKKIKRSKEFRPLSELLTKR